MHATKNFKAVRDTCMHTCQLRPKGPHQLGSEGAVKGSDKVGCVCRVVRGVLRVVCVAVCGACCMQLASNEKKT